MDLSEKKKKLEAIRAAREAKQRLVDQYATVPTARPPSAGTAEPAPAASPVPQPQPRTTALPANAGPPPAAAAAAGALPRRPSTASGGASTTTSTAAKRTASPKTGAAAVRSASPKTSHPPLPAAAAAVAAAATTPSRPAAPTGSATAVASAAPSQLPPKPSRPLAASTAPSSPPPAAPSYRQGLDVFRNWSGLLGRGAGIPTGPLARSDAAGAVTTTAHCALAPKICLGREGRVPIDIAVSSLPYRSERTPQGDGHHGSGRAAPPEESVGAMDSAVCVAVAYSAGSSNRESSVRTDGTEAETAGFPWGAAHAATAGQSGAQRGATVVPLEAASKACRRAPGLALAWTVIPGSATRDGFATAAPLRGTNEEEAAATDAANPDTAIDLVVLTPLLCDVELTSFIAHPFRPGVFIGGTSTGRIVLWQAAAEWVGLDRRQLRARAVATTGSAGTLVWRPQRPCASSFPSPMSHQAPLLRLAVHGDASSHHLYSVSLDGKVGTWAAWQPTEPLAVRTCYLGSRTMGYTGTAAAFAGQRGSDAMAKVYMGTTSGAVLEGFNRDSRVVELAVCGGGAAAPSRANAGPPATGGSDSADSSRRNLGVSSSSLGHSNPAVGGIGLGGGAFPTAQHSGMVTCVAVQAHGDTLRDADCVISAAVDATCIAWLGDVAYRLDNFTAPVTALRWSPTYTALFAAGDAEGGVSLWNVFQSTGMPVYSLSTRQLPMLQPGSSTAAAVLAVGSSGGGGGGVAGDSGLGGGVAGLEAGSLLSVAAAGNMSIVEPVEGAAPAVTSLSFSADGRWLFVGTAPGNVFVLELGQGLY